MISTCVRDPDTVKSKLDMIIRCPYDKTQTLEKLGEKDWAIAFFEGRLASFGEGWETRRRNALKRLLSEFAGNYKIKDESQRLVLDNIKELLDEPPSWIGCTNGKIIVGETERDVKKEIKKHITPDNQSYLLINLVD